VCVCVCVCETHTQCSPLTLPRSLLIISGSSQSCSNVVTLMTCVSFFFFLPLRLISGEMARIHAIHAHNGCIPKPNLWIKMRKYLSLVATEFTDQASNIR